MREDEEQQIGQISMWTSVCGLLLPALIAGGLVLLNMDLLRTHKKFLGLCLLLGGVIELVALVSGIVSRHTGTGNMGMSIAIFALVVLIVVQVVTHYLPTFSPGTGGPDAPPSTEATQPEEPAKEAKPEEKPKEEAKP